MRYKDFKIIEETETEIKVEFYTKVRHEMLLPRGLSKEEIEKIILAHLDEYEKVYPETKLS